MPLAAPAEIASCHDYSASPGSRARTSLDEASKLRAASEPTPSPS
jgi:hypothetical protein